jgi:hypothetical protein
MHSNTYNITNKEAFLDQLARDLRDVDAMNVDYYDDATLIAFYPSNVLMNTHHGDIATWKAFADAVDAHYPEGITFEEGDGGLTIDSNNGFEVIEASVCWNEREWGRVVNYDVRVALELMLLPSWSWKLLPLFKSYFWIRAHALDALDTLLTRYAYWKYDFTHRN